MAAGGLGMGQVATWRRVLALSEGIFEREVESGKDLGGQGGA